VYGPAARRIMMDPAEKNICGKRAGGTCGKRNSSGLRTPACHRAVRPAGR